MGSLRKRLLAGAALCLLLCCGCDQEEPSVPTEVLDFDLDTAAAMVDEVEWLCTWLQTQDTVSRGTAEAFVDRVNQLLRPSEGDNLLAISLTDAADRDDPALETLTIRHDMIQPTVYYEGISLVSATEERRCETAEETGACREHIASLRIRKEYAGDDPELQGWYLEYVFTQYAHDGDWSFTCYNSTESINVPAQLSLRPAFAEAPYTSP